MYMAATARSVLKFPNYVACILIQLYVASYNVYIHSNHLVELHT